ncbi:hypothetical protein [Parabacteroides sp. AF17-28]|jgi:hypothetical protein|uniref:hypothetical protein n=1 Tax=Parabacteroides sp. AF17-28 TaxID=2292241 RepID=UPI000F00F7B8|nr:hypothetical protein [Parabacteroides sp. AF17-28]RHR62687.1 hypothetical protein DWW90_00195 [Parabacteroides sp. AF17-28]
MKPKQFFEAVVKLRQLQKEYFRTRSSITLQASKRQEKLIDDEISRVNSVLLGKNKQGELGL